MKVVVRLIQKTIYCGLNEEKMHLFATNPIHEFTITESEGVGK